MKKTFIAPKAHVVAMATAELICNSGSTNGGFQSTSTNNSTGTIEFSSSGNTISTPTSMDAKRSGGFMWN